MHIISVSNEESTPGEVTPLSSWKPCATEKKLHFLNYITKMGQNFIKFLLGVDIHGIYYIVEINNQIWWSFFLENIPFLTRMT